MHKFYHNQLINLLKFIYLDKFFEPKPFYYLTLLSINPFLLTRTAFISSPISSTKIINRSCKVSFEKPLSFPFLTIYSWRVSICLIGISFVTSFIYEYPKKVIYERYFTLEII